MEVIDVGSSNNKLLPIRLFTELILSVVKLCVPDKKWWEQTSVLVKILRSKNRSANSWTTGQLCRMKKKIYPNYVRICNLSLVEIDIKLTREMTHWWRSQSVSSTLVSCVNCKSPVVVEEYFRLPIIKLMTLRPELRDQKNHVNCPGENHILISETDIVSNLIVILASVFKNCHPANDWRVIWDFLEWNLWIFCFYPVTLHDES